MEILFIILPPVKIITFNIRACVLSCFSCVWLFTILWTVALRLLCPWDSPGKTTGVGCHFILQGSFPTQGLNTCLLHWQAGSLPRSQQGLHGTKIKRMISEVKVTQSCQTLATPWTVAHKGPLSMGFSRQDYWSGLPFPSPGDLPDPGIEPMTPALQADSLPTELGGKP